jgi:hypothetical protein
MDLVLCVSLPRTGRAALLGVRDGRFVRLGCTADFAPAMDRFIARVAADGLVRQVESFGDDTIAVGVRHLAPTDAGYLDAAVSVLRAEGYEAVLYDSCRAEIWRLLVTLPIDVKLRETLLPELGALSDDLAAETFEKLKRTEKDLAENAATLKEEMTTIDTEEAEAKKEIENEIRELMEKDENGPEK